MIGRICQMINRRTIAVLIDLAILDGLDDGQVRMRLLACGWSIDLARIDGRRKRMQKKGVPV
jgi:hypothetical protein